ncbi:MAG: hypothetical protein EXR81_06990 [Gammaproteobacteria bacterium]|nr:hypothetical protein [Gammaproteobacteria bacterium]
MQIIHTKTADLIPYVNNARTHSELQINQIIASIKEFGFTNPILVDGANGIIAGHGRVLAAKKMGMDSIPVIELVHLTAKQRKAYVIADNKLALNSGWNAQLLTLEIEELMGLEFNLDAIGFDGFDNFGEDFDSEIGDIFRPILTPTIGQREINEADIVKAGDRIERTFDGTLKRYFGVTCPECGEDFSLEDK